VTRRDCPPERVSATDVYRVFVGLVSLACGAIILSRTLPAGLNAVAVVTGVAFVAFGVYRLRLAGRRYLDYRRGLVGKVGERGY